MTVAELIDTLKSLPAGHHVYIDAATDEPVRSIERREWQHYGPEVVVLTSTDAAIKATATDLPAQTPPAVDDLPF